MHYAMGVNAPSLYVLSATTMGHDLNMEVASLEWCALIGTWASIERMALQC